MVFKNVESLEIQNLDCLYQVIKFFNKVSSERQIEMLQSIKKISIHTYNFTPSEQESAFIELKDFLLHLENLESVNLKALRIGENLGDMIACFKRP